MATVLTAELIVRAAKLPGASAFPFLKAFAKKPKPGCCGKPSRGPNPAKAIAAVGRLSGARLAAFKVLVGADRLVVWTVVAARQVKIEI